MQRTGENPTYPQKMEMKITRKELFQQEIIPMKVGPGLNLFVVNGEYCNDLRVKGKEVTHVWFHNQMYILPLVSSSRSRKFLWTHFVGMEQNDIVVSDDENREMRYRVPDTVTMYPCSDLDDTRMFQSK